MELFRLEKLRIKNNPIFKDNTFDFSDIAGPQSSEGPYFTLVIGPNGTGKSNLLRYLIDIFRVVYTRKHNIEFTGMPKGKFLLEYFLTDASYMLTNGMGWEFADEPPKKADDAEQAKGLRAFKNGEEIPIKDLSIPKSINALSIMLTDNFLVMKDNHDYPIYNYLGVRRDANTAGTRNYITRTIEHIFQAAKDEMFLENVRELLKFLELKEEFYISYTPRYKHYFFKGSVTLDFFEDFFQNNSKYLDRKTEPWSVEVFKSIKSNEPEVIPKLVELLNYISTKLQNYEDSRAKFFEFNIFSLNEDAISILELLPYLHRLDLISYPYIVVSKSTEEYYDFESSSSGEYHFISTMMGLLATITDNSLNLIDEPEISLHPNWQMKYLDFLNKLTMKYNSAHFVICTHSHFLVSDLKPENSTILSITKKDGAVTAGLVNKEPYGWSAENVLLNIFGVATTRNFYIADQLAQIFKIASTQKNPDLSIYKNKLLGWHKQLNSADPLHYTIEKLINRMGWLD